jgi:putative aldouronate transport system substrate-binding protein
MKRSMCLLLSLVLLLTAVLTGCSGTPASTTEPASTSGESQSAAPAGSSSADAGTAVATTIAAPTASATAEPVEVTVFRGVDLTQNFDDSMFVNFVKEKFNLALKYEYTPSSTAAEKLNLSFATNTYPQMLDIVALDTVNRLAADGFILPISEHMDKLPTYRNAYRDDDWDVMVKSISNAKEKFFLLPQKWAEDSTGTWVWMYRIDEFKKVGLSLPKTTDDFLQAMRTLKKGNPNLTIPNRWGLWNVLEGFNLAFRVQYGIWFDPDAGDVVYGPATDKYRDLMKFMHTLFKEQILSQEFVTMTSEQRVSEVTKGNVYANFQFAGAEVAFNAWQKSNGLPQDWAYDESALLLSAYPDKKPMRQHWPMYMNVGVALTDTISGAALDRVLQYIDWSCTEEGQFFHEFGVESISYQMVDGHPAFIDDKQPGGNYQDTLSNFGPFGYWLIQNEWWASTQYPGQVVANRATADISDKCDLNPLPVRLTADEESALADIGVVLTQVRDEWTQAFIMGNKDPNDEAQWVEYLSKLRDVGLDQYVATKKEAHNRLN